MRLIDADAYLKKLKADPLYPLIERYGVEGTIEAVPTVDAEPTRHRNWIWGGNVFRCSDCSFKAYGNTLECMDGTYRYCPYCGARMETKE